jgi:Ca-activated chloride channel family protein
MGRKDGSYVSGVALVLLCAAAVAAQQPSVAPSFRTRSSELVVLPVTVVDRSGRFVADLPRERFAVYDNNRPQTVAFFSNEDTPVSIAVVIDDSGSMRQKLGQVVAATMTFAKTSHPEDQLFAIDFNDSVRDLLNGRSVAAADAGGLEQALRRLVAEGRTALYDALMFAMDRLETAPFTRKVLVVMSDGGDNASRATLEEVLDRARRSSVTIYTIGLFDRGAPDTNPGVLKDLATTTGGERFLPASPGPLVQACLQIAREIRSSYTIAFEPPDRDGRFHSVRVALGGPEGRQLRIRTRPGYFAAATMGE